MSLLKQSLDEDFLQSPMPTLYKLRNTIYGKNKPPLWDKIIYFLSSLISLIFLLWHLLAFLAVFLRNQVFEKKKIAVDDILAKKAKEFGYTLIELIWSLQIHHIISSILWVSVLFLLIIYWRGKIFYQFLILFLVLIYLGQGVYFFGWNFLHSELTNFDKLMLIVFTFLILLSILIFSYFTRKHKDQTMVI